MIKNIEFYNTPDGQVCCKPLEEPMFVLKESDTALIADMLTMIQELYPAAFAALSELYSRSELNKNYYHFRMVHRFIRCNFGEYDALSMDVNASGHLRFEDVRCPLRGECPFECIICKPTLDSKLSEREQQVAKLLSEGFTADEIGKELHISPHTVKRHIANIKTRLKLTHTHQIISKFSKEL